MTVFGSDVPQIADKCLNSGTSRGYIAEYLEQCDSALKASIGNTRNLELVVRNRESDLCRKLSTSEYSTIVEDFLLSSLGHEKVKGYLSDVGVTTFSGTSTTDTQKIHQVVVMFKDFFMKKSLRQLDNNYEDITKLFRSSFTIFYKDRGKDVLDKVQNATSDSSEYLSSVKISTGDIVSSASTITFFKKHVDRIRKLNTFMFYSQTGDIMLSLKDLGFPDAVYDIIVNSGLLRKNNNVKDNEQINLFCDIYSYYCYLQREKYNSRVIKCFGDAISSILVIYNVIYKTAGIASRKDYGENKVIHKTRYADYLIKHILDENEVVEQSRIWCRDLEELQPYTKKDSAGKNLFSSESRPVIGKQFTTICEGMFSLKSVLSEARMRNISIFDIPSYIFILNLVNNAYESLWAYCSADKTYRTASEGEDLDSEMIVKLKPFDIKNIAVKTPLTDSYELLHEFCLYIYNPFGSGVDKCVNYVKFREVVLNACKNYRYEGDTSRKSYVWFDRVRGFSLQVLITLYQQMYTNPKYKYYIVKLNNIFISCGVDIEDSEVIDKLHFIFIGLNANERRLFESVGNDGKVVLDLGISVSVGGLYNGTELDILNKMLNSGEEYTYENICESFNAVVIRELGDYAYQYFKWSRKAAIKDTQLLKELKMFLQISYIFMDWFDEILQSIDEDNSYILSYATLSELEVSKLFTQETAIRKVCGDIRNHLEDSEFFIFERVDEVEWSIAVQDIVSKIWESAEAIIVEIKNYWDLLCMELSYTELGQAEDFSVDERVISLVNSIYPRIFLNLSGDDSWDALNARFEKDDLGLFKYGVKYVRAVKGDTKALVHDSGYLINLEAAPGNEILSYDYSYKIEC
jgi:hypothetical protein